MTIGQQIIAAIDENSGQKFHYNKFIAWSSGAAEQLEAVVEAHVAERVKTEAEKHLSLIRMIRASFSAEGSEKFTFVESQALKAMEFHLKQIEPTDDGGS